MRGRTMPAICMCLALLLTASAYGQRYMHTQVDEMMSRYILPALRER